MCNVKLRSRVKGEYILRKLIEFNAEHMPARVPSNHEQLNLIMRHEDGSSQLLCEIERLALERHSECIQLDTYSFQAHDVLELPQKYWTGYS